MSTETFGKDNLDEILKTLAKEYKKLGGKSMPAEIILVGGAAIIANYGFREMTTDIDAIIQAASMMKDAINRVGDSLNLPNGWLNDDFIKTESYSGKLSEISSYYKSFFGVLNVRTVSAEYLVAMKLKAGRKYKNDLSDIVGILAEHKRKGNEITYDMINIAVEKLYGGWDSISSDSKAFIVNLMQNENYESIYQNICDGEKEAKELLIDFEDRYPNVTTNQNVESILKALKDKRK